jgi:hypothetical protein
MLPQPIRTYLLGRWAVRLGARRLERRRRRGQGRNERVVLLADGSASVPVLLEGDLPDEAYALLFTLDAGSLAPGPVGFDRAHGRWVLM